VSCFRCPYTGEKHCDGGCGMCPEGECPGDDTPRSAEAEEAEG